MVDVKKHHKFFFKKFHRRNFDPRRIFYEKLICGLAENAQNGHMTAKNAIFQRFRPLWAQYLGFGSKWPIDTLYNLPIINIGRIGQFIKNRKLAIFWQFWSNFYTEIQPKKIKLRKMTFFGSQTQFFTSQTNLNWFGK